MKDFADFMKKPRDEWSWRSMKDDPPHFNSYFYGCFKNGEIVEILHTNYINDLECKDRMFWSPVFIPEPYKDEAPDWPPLDYEDNACETCQEPIKLKDVFMDKPNNFEISQELERAKKLLEVINEMTSKELQTDAYLTLIAMIVEHIDDALTMLG